MGSDGSFIAFTSNTPAGQRLWSSKKSVQKERQDKTLTGSQKKGESNPLNYSAETLGQNNVTVLDDTVISQLKLLCSSKSDKAVTNE